MEIEVINWEKFNPRKDLKATTWFRLQNGLFEDPNFFDFTHAELLVWLYLLSICSKKRSGTITVNFAHAERVARLKPKDVKTAIEKLEELQCVRVTERARNVDVTRNADVTPTSHYERTNEQDERNERTVPAGSVEPAGAETVSTRVWRAYSGAYRDKYGVEPLRNATVNAQIKAFVARVPGDEAEAIARFYLTHADWFYTKNRHPVGAMLRDAEKLRTEWATGVKSTSAEARSADQMQGVRSQMERVLRGEL